MCSSWRGELTIRSCKLKGYNETLINHYFENLSGKKKKNLISGLRSINIMQEKHNRNLYNGAQNV